MKGFKSVRFEGRNAQHTDMLMLLSEAHQRNFLENKKWPDEGLPPTTVQGITVWVKPIVREPGKKSSKHRVLCKCPTCGQEMSAGRLFQHVCSEAA